jgi:predicted CoA-binding protein
VSDPAPGPIPRPTRDDLLRIYADTKVIAVVGASDDTSKPAGNIPAYLQSQGYRIIPVNPVRETVLGERSYPTLADVPEPVDVVDVFRPAAEAAEIARAAAAVGAKVIWFQPGTQSGEASRIAHDAGLTVVSRLCMGATHGTLGLGPGPDEPEHG